MPAFVDDANACTSRLRCRTLAHVGHLLRISRRGPRAPERALFRDRSRLQTRRRSYGLRRGERFDAVSTACFGRVHRGIGSNEESLVIPRRITAGNSDRGRNRDHIPAWNRMGGLGDGAAYPLAGYPGPCLAGLRKSYDELLPTPTRDEVCTPSHGIQDGS